MKPRWGKARSILFNLLAVVSSLLALTAAGLWVRGYFVNDTYEDTQLIGSIPNLVFTDWGVHTYRGSLSAGYMHFDYMRVSVASRQPGTSINFSSWLAAVQAQAARHPHVKPSWQRIKPRSAPRSLWPIHYTVLDLFPGLFGIFFTASWWFVVLLLSLLPARWIALHRRRAAKAGHCPKCDYDLRANTSGVCPECGAAVLMIEDRREVISPTI